LSIDLPFAFYTSLDFDFGLSFLGVTGFFVDFMGKEGFLIALPFLNARISIDFKSRRDASNFFCFYGVKLFCGTFDATCF
jgi:hypothetical protein